MTSLDELKKIKEKVLKEMKNRDSNKRGKIIVAMGTCGIAAGAKETLKSIIEELNKENINDISVVQSGCMGYCEVEPTIEVKIEGEEPILYGHVDANNAKRIVESHIKNGKVVSDLLIKKGQ
jgi:NADP-reducing hydrogenase subunit HndB